MAAKIYELKNGVKIKRHFFNGVHYTIDREKKVVKLSPEMQSKLLNKNLWGRFGYKKVGGSSLGGVLGSNKFSSFFAESLRTMWLGEPMYDDIFVQAGVAIEPKIIKAMEMVIGRKLSTYPAPDWNYDFFSDNDDVGGLPDAFDQTTGKLYEIKTTGWRNLEKWDKFGVPKYYQQQACLYDYLMWIKDKDVSTIDPKTKRTATVVACFLQPEDYADPEAVDIKERKMKTYKVEYEVSEMQWILDVAKKFRRKIMTSGESFPFDENKDAETLEYLECKNEEEFISFLKKKGHI